MFNVVDEAGMEVFSSHVGDGVEGNFQADGSRDGIGVSGEKTGRRRKNMGREGKREETWPNGAGTYLQWEPIGYPKSK